MKIVLITRDRPELTRQTIETMKANAADWSKHKLLVVFDGDEDSALIAKTSLKPLLNKVFAFYHWTGTQIGVGGAKTCGADWFINDVVVDNEILMFSDNDMYYLPNWDRRLEDIIRFSDINPSGLDYSYLKSIVQLGGWKHPYHKGKHWFNFGPERTDLVDAVTGNCFVIRWADWLKYGPFDSNAIGPGQSEDYALSQKIKAAGGIVATLDPPVAIHVGLANCLGEPAVGWEEMSKMVEQQIKEYGIDKIWLATPDEGTILIEKLSVQNTAADTNVVVGTYAVNVTNYSSNGNSKDFLALNLGSGQRRFDNKYGWLNLDIASRPGQVPDMLCDATKLAEKIPPSSVDLVVSHHLHEHQGCNEADPITKGAYEVLKPGGSLLVFTPDVKKLAGRWLNGELDDFQFAVQVMGAYQGLETDRHKWLYTQQTLEASLRQAAPWSKVIPFDWREIPGSDFAKDWYIAAVECIK
jgi:predicted SAM-dependent methyltransferase